MGRIINEIKNGIEPDAEFIEAVLTAYPDKKFNELFKLESIEKQ